MQAVVATGYRSYILAANTREAMERGEIERKAEPGLQKDLLDERARTRAQAKAQRQLVEEAKALKQEQSLDHGSGSSVTEEESASHLTHVHLTYEEELHEKQEAVRRRCKPPRYRWHLGCILLKMPAISLRTGVAEHVDQDRVLGTGRRITLADEVLMAVSNVLCSHHHRRTSSGLTSALCYRAG